MTTLECVEAINVFVGHVAWPSVVIGFSLVYRKDLKKVVNTLSNRLCSAKSVKLTSSGIEIEDYIAAVEAKTDVQQVVQGDILSMVSAQNIAIIGRQQQSVESSLRILREYAQEYQSTKITDWQARVDRKNELVRLMAIHICGAKLNRADLTSCPEEGVLAGLAGAIHLDPRPGDLGLLVSMIDTMKTKHGFYKIVMALARLIDSGHVKRSDMHLAEVILDAALARADKPLEKRVQKTRALMLLTFTKGSSLLVSEDTQQQA